MCGQAFQVSPLDNSAVAGQIYQLFQRSYAIEAALLGATNFPPLTRTIADIETSDSDFLGVYVEDSLVGAVELESDSGRVLIASLVVDPDHFRQGIARLLLRYVISAASDKVLQVETATANQPALRLYLGAGFVEASRYVTEDGVHKTCLRYARA